MFRNKGLIALGIVLAFIILISLIFSDIWIEKELENIGDQLIGAKVEIDNLDFSFTELYLSWRRLQVTNPKNTMMPEPISMDFTNWLIGAHNNMGINAPNTIAIPPTLGVGSLCTFLSSGISMIFAL